MARRLIVIFSAVVLAILGGAAVFAPDEIFAALQESHSPLSSLVLQIAGALYLSFAIANWFARDSRIGGIYNRPLALANSLHFSVGALAISKSTHAIHAPWLAAIAIVYWFFAVAFVAILFTSPVAAAE